MVAIAYNVVSGGVWLLCGLVILYLAVRIAFLGHAESHSHYDKSVDPAYVARWAGGSAVVMGLIVTGYAIRDLLYGWDPTAFGGMLVSLLVLSYLSKLFAQGWPVKNGLLNRSSKAEAEN